VSITTDLLKNVLWVPGASGLRERRPHICYYDQREFVPADIKLLRRSESRGSARGIVGRPDHRAHQPRTSEEEKASPSAPMKAIQR